MNPHNKHANYKNALTYVYYVFQWNMDNILYDIISSKIHMVTVIYLSSSFAVVVLGVRSYTGCHWNIPWTELETMQGCGWNCWGNAATGGVGLCHGAPSDWEVDLGENFNNFFGIKWLQHKNPYIYIYWCCFFAWRKLFWLGDSLDLHMFYCSMWDSKKRRKYVSFGRHTVQPVSLFLTSENDGILRALVRRSTKSTVFWSFRFSPPDMVTFCKFEVHTHKNNYPRNKNMEHFNAFEIPWLLTRKASKRRTKLGMERNGEGPWLWQELGCWVEQWQFYGTLIQQKEKDNAF